MSSGTNMYSLDRDAYFSRLASAASATVLALLIVLLKNIFKFQINLNLGQTELVDYCKSQGILVVAYSPLGTMIPNRAAPNTPEPKLDNPTLVAIAKKYNKTVTQVTFRYLVSTRTKRFNSTFVV